MSTLTGSTLGVANAYSDFKNVTSIGITCPAGQYPTRVTFDGIVNETAYWYNPKTSSGYSGSGYAAMKLCLCESDGSNIVELFTIQGYGGRYNTSGAVIDGSSLAGKSLYLVDQYGTSGILLYNTTTVTVELAGIPHTLTVNAGTGGSLSASPSGTIQTGETVTLTPSANTGYSFNNYTSSPSVSISNNQFTMPNSDLTVTANFTHIERTLSYAISPSGGGAVTLAANKGYYQSVINISAIAATGYTFSNWTTTGGTIANENDASTSITMPDANATVTANFTHVKYNISLSANPLSGGSATSRKPQAYYDERIPITATPAPGYRFLAWITSGGTIGDSLSASTYIVMPASYVGLIARFEKVDYDILAGINPSGGGTLTVDVTPEHYATRINASTGQVGDTVTLISTPASGYGFIGYTSDPTLTITNNQFTMPASNVSVVANYEALYSYATLDNTTYEGGETAVLTITERTTDITHRYRLMFNQDMDTGWVDVPAGDTTVNIYIPVEWGLHTIGSLSVTGGTLTLETIINNTVLGTDTVTGLTYTVLDNTIPRFTLWRCNISGSATKDGQYARYSITIPSSVDSYSITFDETVVQNPALTGDILPNDKQEMSINNNHIITFSITVDGETFTTTRDIPKISKLNKALTNRR